MFIAGEPYDKLGIANGLAFSTPPLIDKEFTLRVIHSHINKTVYNNKKKISDFNTDLRVWAEQGVLLFNASLTTKLHKNGKHIDIWKPFTSHLLDMLNSNNSKLVYVFFGDVAQHYADLIDEDKNLIIKVDTPGTNGYTWDCKDLFNKSNEYLDKNNRFKIVW